VAISNNTTVMLGLLDAKNLSGVNDSISIAAGDLYLLSCISIIHRVSQRFFENSWILRRTTGDEFWLVCARSLSSASTTAHFEADVSEEFAYLESFTGLRDLAHPKNEKQTGIGLHSAALILSTDETVTKHSSARDSWGSMIDFCEKRLKD